MDSAYTLLFILQSSTLPNKATRLFRTLYLETEQKPIWIISQKKPLFGFGIIHQTHRGLFHSRAVFGTFTSQPFSLACVFVVCDVFFCAKQKNGLDIEEKSMHQNMCSQLAKKKTRYQKLLALKYKTLIHDLLHKLEGLSHNKFWFHYWNSGNKTCFGWTELIQFNL